MRGQPDLLGEALSRPEVRSEIIEIAWQEAEKRRVAEEEIARKRGKQQRLDGTVAMCRGYAVYADFNEYMGQKMAQRRLKPTRGGWYHFIIKEALEVAGWKRETAHRATRFYPPGTESPNLGRTLKGGET